MNAVRTPQPVAAAPVRAAPAALERDADASAAAALRQDKPGATARGLLPGPVATAPRDRLLAAAIDHGGVPLPSALRSRFEAAYGVDFAGVRLHDHEAAHHRMHDARALAATWGPHVLFARGRCAPATGAGLQLLAHELAHVRQAAQGAAPALRSKPDPAAPVAPWYQEAVDLLNASQQELDAQRQSGAVVIVPTEHEIKQAVLGLCQAIDGGNAAAITAAAQELFRHPLLVHRDALSAALMNEMAARLFGLGLDALASQLRRHFAQGQAEVFPAESSARDVDYVQRLMRLLVAPPAAPTPAALAADLRQYRRVFVELRGAYAAINWAVVEMESRHTPLLRHGMRESDKRDALAALLGDWLRLWNTYVQSVLDAARRDLETAQPDGSGAALLAALHADLAGPMRDALYPADPAQNISRSESFAITRTRISRPGSGHIVDTFAPADAQRQVEITTFNPRDRQTEELHGTLDGSYVARVGQVELLARLHGVGAALPAQADGAKRQAAEQEAADNAAVARRLAARQLRLDSDDDWRHFLDLRFDSLVNPPAESGRQPMDRVAAFKQLVELLFTYLRSYTVHVRYTNIYDTGRQPYTNRAFPRALTGQAAHDCGVYALRAAYALSLLRQRLGLRFFLVSLPEHVMLVITGAAIGGTQGAAGSDLPTVLVQNDSYQWIDAGDAEAQFSRWKQVTDPDTGLPLPGPHDETQFLGEAAVSDFLPGRTTAPFRLEALPAPVGNDAAEQAQLWDAYTRAAANDVLGPAATRPGGKNDLFAERYRRLVERRRTLRNAYLVPLHNVQGPQLWRDFRQQVQGSRVGDEVAVGALRPALRDYSDRLHNLLAPLVAGEQGVGAEQDAIAQDLAADPQLAKRDARRSSGARLQASWSYFWQQHLARVERALQALGPLPASARRPLADIDQITPEWAKPDAERLAPED